MKTGFPEALCGSWQCPPLSLVLCCRRRICESHVYTDNWTSDSPTRHRRHRASRQVSLLRTRPGPTHQSGFPSSSVSSTSLRRTLTLDTLRDCTSSGVQAVCVCVWGWWYRDGVQGLVHPRLVLCHRPPPPPRILTAEFLVAASLRTAQGAGCKTDLYLTLSCQSVLLDFWGRFAAVDNWRSGLSGKAHDTELWVLAHCRLGVEDVETMLMVVSQFLTIQTKGVANSINTIFIKYLYSLFKCIYRTIPA